MRILRLHLLEHKPISQLCEEEGIHPTLFYQWQKAFFENGAAAFERPSRPDSAPRRDQIAETLKPNSNARTRSSPRSCRGPHPRKKSHGAS